MESFPHFPFEEDTIKSELLLDEDFKHNQHLSDIKTENEADDSKTQQEYFEEDTIKSEQLFNEY